MESTPKKRKLNQDEILNTPSTKRSRKELTLKQKYDLVQEAEKKAKSTQKELGIKLGIGKTTVSDILKRKSEYTQLFEENTTSQRKQHNSGSKYGELNDLVFKWFKQARANNIPLNRPIIQEKAMEFVTDLKFMDFKASNGWLESWRSRFSIGLFKVCGESADVDDNVVDDFRSKIGKIVEGYKAEDIFNAMKLAYFSKHCQIRHLHLKVKHVKEGSSRRNVSR